MLGAKGTLGLKEDPSPWGIARTGGGTKEGAAGSVAGAGGNGSALEGKIIGNTVEGDLPVVGAAGGVVGR